MARKFQTLDLDLKLISSENVISDGRLHCIVKAETL